MAFKIRWQLAVILVSQLVIFSSLVFSGLISTENVSDSIKSCQGLTNQNKFVFPQTL